MDEAGITLARRYSGGGAVYQDLGCTTFTFAHELAPSESPTKIIDSNFNLLVSALQSLGLPAERKGRNDLVIGDYKVSGSAFKQGPTRLIHHGTILVTTDLSRLGKFLTPSKLKLKSKGISSVAARVSNLSASNPSVDHDVVCDALTKAFRDVYGCQEKSDAKIIDEEIQSDPVFVRHHDKLRDWDWRYGTTPHFSHTVETRIEGVGMFECHYEVDSGRISKMKIFSDILIPELIDELEATLLDCQYNPSSIARVLDRLTELQPDETRKSIVQEFKKWLLYEVSAN